MYLSCVINALAHCYDTFCSEVTKLLLNTYLSFYKPDFSDRLNYFMKQNF
jgi:hypothetical protein